jgi:class 3 adenylate cyclase
VMQERPDAYLEAVRRFARELHEEEAELESVLATVLFTDIVDSTARQAEIDDRSWAVLRQGPGSISQTGASTASRACRGRGASTRWPESRSGNRGDAGQLLAPEQLE